MKKLLLLAVALTLTVCAKALEPTDSQMWWGYYTGNDIDFLGSGNAETFDCAILVPANHNLVGTSTIKAVRFYIPTVSNVSMTKVWISKELPSSADQADYVQEVNVSSMSDGYNDIELTTPFEVNNQAIYVGYSFTIKQVEYCVTIGSEYVANSCYVQSTSFTWEDVPYGALILHLLLDGGTYPTNYATVDNFEPAVVGLGQSVDVPVKITNGGKDPITSISFTITSDGATSTEEKTVETSAIPYAATAKVKIPFEADATIGTVTKTLTITKVNGNDNTASNNTATGNLTTIAELKTWDRNVLIEEFTTEKCVYCPDAAAGLHEFMTENPDLAKRTAAVCHHAGYGTDWLTIDASEQYTWFYNGGGTYAPAFMYDRFDWGDGTPVVSRGNYKEYVEERLAETSYAGIDLITAFDGDKLNVTANCERGWDFSSTPIRITLFLTEDNIAAQSQSGASGNFTHQHVLRATNETWGSILEWDGNKASYSYTFNIDSSWKTDDLKVVAFVSGYDSNNPTNCVVENVAYTVAGSSSDPVTAIKALSTEDKVAKTVYYDLTGRLVANPSNGLFIKAVTYQNGKTVTKKVVLK